ncbi:guanine nucleotide exchange protein smcr8b [Pholidichthys leucotaenia]
MIGSPDLVAFTGMEGFGVEEEEKAEGLPEEFSVPLQPSAHPWATSAQFYRDFILVAEFSEQVGPKPVLTIPDNPKVIGSLDLNHFSVRIMSVDYQASGPGHTPPSSPGPRLNFSEDSRVVLGDSAVDAFAYVHHLTLYDLEARGMVRPFCMAYVCSDQQKLMENFSDISEHFSEASESLKTGNRKAFSMELQRKLQELECRRSNLLQENVQRMENGSTGVERKGDELEAVDHLISNHKDLLRQVTSYPNRKLRQPNFFPYDPAGSLTDQAPLLPPEPCSSSSSFCSSDQRLKPLEELCNSYFLSLMKDRLTDTYRQLRDDRSLLQTAHTIQELSRRAMLTNFLFKLWSPEDADKEEREGGEVEMQKAPGSRKNAEASQAELLSTEPFFSSCVEEIPIKLVTGDTETVSLDPGASAEMTGSVSSGDSIEVLGTEKSYRAQQENTGSGNRETLVDSYIRRPAVDAGIRRVRACAKRANSEDSIEVLSTTESIFPDDLTAITEEEAEQQPVSNGFEDEEEPRADGKSHQVYKEETTLNGADLLKEDEKDESAQVIEGADRERPVEEILAGVPEIIKDKLEDNTGKKTSKLLQVGEAVESSPHWSDIHQKVRLVPHLHVNLAPPVSLVTDPWFLPHPLLRPLSIDEVSESTSFTGSSEPSSPTANIHNNTSWDKRSRRKAGLRALRFIKQNSFSQQAVFCLLSGRPLVVVGGDKNLVRKQVDALSLFLPAPGPDRNAVNLCLNEPLKLTDLLVWRLMGVHRSSTSSSTILQSLTCFSRYLALLDLDQRTLRCPPYSGSLISRLANPRTSISHGITYLLHLESSLTALANQVLLYTFKPALHHQDTAKGNGGVDEKEFLCSRGLCSSEYDLRVMRFLSDLIKQRHVGRGPSVFRFSYSSVHLHRNAYTP